MELGALLRARRAVSRSERDESPWAWWLKRIAFSLGGLWVVGGSFGTALAFAGRPDVTPERLAVLVFLGPAGVALIMAGAQTREAAIHPLGEARVLLPLGRWRSSLLALAESLLSGQVLFILALGWVPWLGVLLSGALWLNGFGWLTALLLPLAVVAVREILGGLSFRASLATGRPQAMVRALGWLVGLSLPVGAFIVRRELTPQSGFDPFALPILDWANSASGPLSMVSLVGVGLVAAATVRAAHIPGFRARPRRDVALPAGPAVVRFSHRKNATVITRLSVVRVWRQSATRFTVGAAAAGAAAISLFPAATGLSFVAVSFLVGPIVDLLNVYGADQRAAAAWVGSGRPLRDWTLARLVTHSVVAFGGVAGAALAAVAAGGLPPGLLPGLVPIPVMVVAAGWLMGPRLSRFTLSWRPSEVGPFVRQGGGSGRLWLAALVAYVVTGLAGGIGGWMAVAGFGFVNWLAAGVIVGALALSRTWETPWTLGLRKEMAERFR